MIIGKVKQWQCVWYLLSWQLKQCLCCVHGDRYDVIKNIISRLIASSMYFNKKRWIWYNWVCRLNAVLYNQNLNEIWQLASTFTFSRSRGMTAFFYPSQSNSELHTSKWHGTNLTPLSSRSGYRIYVRVHSPHVFTIAGLSLLYEDLGRPITPVVLSKD